MSLKSAEEKYITLS